MQKSVSIQPRTSPQKIAKKQHFANFAINLVLRRQELRAKSAEGADTDRVDGEVFFGSSQDRDYYLAGRFTLVRNTDDQLDI